MRSTRDQAVVSLRSNHRSGTALVLAALTCIGWTMENASAEESYGPPQHAELGNTAAVSNGPRNPTQLKFATSALVTKIQTYHWNDGKGQKPGRISVIASDGFVHGPWQAKGLPGQGGVPNAYWVAEPRHRLPQGTYTVRTSSNRTWATNAGSNWRGFVVVEWRDILAGSNSTPPDRTTDTDDDQAEDGMPWVTELLRLHQPRR